MRDSPSGLPFRSMFLNLKSVPASSLFFFQMTPKLRLLRFVFAVEFEELPCFIAEECFKVATEADGRLKLLTFSPLLADTDFGRYFPCRSKGLFGDSSMHLP